MSAEKITREKIINAVLECSFVNGVGATSLSDIAGKLGIKKASLYNHYESRDAMIDDTIRFCGEYVRKISFIPADMDSTAQKYSADTVLKGIAHRWFKMNEKDPLFQIYSFIESEKYFSSKAAEIKQELTKKLTAQTETAFRSLITAKKIQSADIETVHSNAEIFTYALSTFLDNYLVEKKIQIRSNPATGAGELFSAPQTDPDFTKLNILIERFSKFL